MPSIWEHYAEANDDIRHQLIDRMWFQDRMARHPSMKSDVMRMEAAEPEGETIDFADQVQQTQEFAELYGHPPEQSESTDIWGHTESQTTGEPGYGYDALDDDLDQDESLTQRL